MRKTFMPKRGELAGVMLAAAVFAPAAHAQVPRTEGPSLEFRSDLPWSKLVLQREAKITGVSTLRVPGPLRGDHWLSASGKGIETQRGRVGIRLDEEGSRIVSQGGVPFRERTLRSLLFPGFAQAGYLEYGKSTLMGASAIAAIVATGIAQDRVWDKEEIALDAERALEESTDPAAEDALRLQARLANEDENLARAQRNLYLMTTGAVWGLSLVDAMFFAPEFHVTSASDASLSLAMRKRSRTRAAVRSLTFPGQGQYYNGHPRKGIFVATGGIAATVLFLHEQDDFLKAQNAVNQFEARVDLTPPGAERDFFVSELARVQDEADAEARDRNWTLILLGTYWSVAFFETMLSFEQPWGETTVGEGWSFGMSAAPERAAIVASRAF
jgi:hypothetical protein